MDSKEHIRIKYGAKFDEKAQSFLQRQWELIEGNKKLRLQIPTVISTLLIAVTAFVVKLDSKELDNLGALIVLLIILIAAFGLRGLRIIQDQYNYSDSKIKHLYREFKMDYVESLWQDKYEKGTYLFNLGYASMILFAIIALIAAGSLAG